MLCPALGSTMHGFPKLNFTVLGSRVWDESLGVVLGHTRSWRGQEAGWWERLVPESRQVQAALCLLQSHHASEPVSRIPLGIFLSMCRRRSMGWAWSCCGFQVLLVICYL